jgi:hypothetical protein
MVYPEGSEEQEADEAEKCEHLEAKICHSPVVVKPFYDNLRKIFGPLRWVLSGPQQGGIG